MWGGKERELKRMKKVRVFFSLGSNLGNRKYHLKRALRSLAESGVDIDKVSSVYETEPVGVTEQNKFLNMVAQGETKLSPRALIQVCKRIEKTLGRVKTFRFGPRIIDIDILIYNRIKMSSKELTLPHPRLELRNFVLTPFAEIAPRIKHPVKGKTINQLLRRSPDKLKVEKYCKPLSY